MMKKIFGLWLLSFIVMLGMNSGAIAQEQFR